MRNAVACCSLLAAFLLHNPIAAARYVAPMR
jgi:hypothetical protein